MATTDTDLINDLNSLLRGEISAAETYKMAIDKINGDQSQFSVQADQLHAIQREHGLAAQRLRERIHALGGEADDSSGAWGMWAKTVQGTANLFGNPSALKALKEGEEHGLKSYQRKLDDGDLDATAQALAQEGMSQTQQHIAMLDRMIQMAQA